jgi:hypothetical protein
LKQALSNNRLERTRDDARRSAGAFDDSCPGQQEGRTMTQSASAQRIEQVIRIYIQACNDADAEAIAACFVAEAVHYFPSLPKWVGAATIGNNFERRVREHGHCWTVDQLVIDSDRCAATLEWTRFERKHARILRGVDWFVFEPETFRIREVLRRARIPDIGSSRAHRTKVLSAIV